LEQTFAIYRSIAAARQRWFGTKCRNNVEHVSWHATWNPWFMF